MIEFVESGMTFSFTDSDAFHIEKCPAYLTMQKNLKICECIAVRPEQKQLLLLEAKSSFSNPELYIENFDKNVTDITQKVINTLLLYYGLLLNRPYKEGSTLPPALRRDSFCNNQYKIIPVLIINNFQEEWIPPVKDALNNAIKKLFFSKLLLLEDMQVLTKEMAIKFRIVKE